MDNNVKKKIDESKATNVNSQLVLQRFAMLLDITEYIMSPDFDPIVAKQKLFEYKTQKIKDVFAA